MNCFQLIKTVLDEAYAAIPGSDNAKDASMTAALEELRKQYAELTECGCLDYSAPCRRFAYVFRYTTSHANLVYERIRHSSHLSGLFDRPKLYISCVGGGPGSDFLGVLKFCQANSKSPEIKCFLLDRDPAWGESWSDVDDKLGAKLRLSTVFNPFDVTAPAQWSNFTKHYRADLFTLSCRKSTPCESKPSLISTPCSRA